MIHKPRRQPLKVAPVAYVIAVTRVKTRKKTSARPTFDRGMIVETASLIRPTFELPDVIGTQLDFDAAVSEREFYLALMKEIRELIPVETTLTMTSLAQWCTGDAWFNEFPVAEAVPVVFHTGGRQRQDRTFLRNGNDWDEPLRRVSYGLLFGDSEEVKLVPGRRIYYFKDSAWRPSDSKL